MNFLVQNKQNKKDTFFSKPTFGLFGDFLKLEVFPEENPTQKLRNMNMSESENVRIHFWSNPENVRIGKRQNLKMSESELVRI